MKNSRKRLSLMMIALLTATAGTTLAAPPTDDQINAAIDAMRKVYEGMGGEYDAAKIETETKNILKDISIPEASAAQIGKLKQQGLIDNAKLTDVAKQRLQQLAAQPDIDGARAAGQLVGFLPSDIYDEAKRAEYIPELTKNIQNAVNHPGFGELIKANEPIAALQPISVIPAKNLAALAPTIFSLEKYITPDLGIEPTGSMVSAARSLAEAEGVDPAAREQFRAKLAGVVEQSVKNMSESDPLRSRLLRRQGLINGAFIKGQLVNHPAPRMDITWSNLSGNPQTVADLKGKVVVVDFWATWCGPCIGSFPQVRDLAAHYKGSDVVILGVTSLQGNHYSRSLTDKAKRDVIKTEGDPKKEHELMSEFMKDMDMTWNVAFTKQDVFNPDFGVNGIPHVAIIDAKGVVRYRGMHPAQDPEKKLDMIDGLLKEAGLPVPAREAKKDDEKKPDVVTGG